MMKETTNGRHENMIPAGQPAHRRYHREVIP